MEALGVDGIPIYILLQSAVITVPCLPFKQIQQEHMVEAWRSSGQLSGGLIFFLSSISRENIDVRCKFIFERPMDGTKLTTQFNARVGIILPRARYPLDQMPRP